MTLFFGLIIVLFAGFLAGSFYVPMTFTKKWEWEHSWLLFSLTGMFLFSYIFIFLTVPEIFTVYRTAPVNDIINLLIFGGLWGIGGVLTGLSMDKLGMALAYPIVIGIISSLGALLPLILFYPASLFALKGLAVIIGTAITVLGVLQCSRAFSQKQNVGQSGPGMQSGSLVYKLVLAITAGVMSALMNVGFAYGTSLIEVARKIGVAETFAINAAWAIILTSGGAVNVLYCLYLIIKRKNLKQLFGSGTIRNWGLGTVMGLIWCASLYLYGFGASYMGKLGVVIGWVLFTSTNIITGNLWGIWKGEWKGASPKARALLNRGLIILIAAIFIVALSNLL